MPAINTGRIWLPQPALLTLQSTVASITNVADVVMVGCQIPQSGNVTGLKFATQTVTTGCTIRGSIQTLGADSKNTGTLIDANASGTVVVADADDSVIKTVTFAAPVAVTRGDHVAVVLDVSSGTPATLQIRTNATFTPGNFPYMFKIQSTVPSFSAATPALALTYDTGDVAISSVMCYSTGANQAISTSTTPDELGMKFTMPYSAQSDGYVFRMQNNAGIQACDVNLYDSADSVLATDTLNINSYIGTGVSSYATGYWNSPANLLKGRSYRVVLTPTTTTSWTCIQKGTGLVASPDAGSIAQCFTSRVNAGAWTDDATSFVPMAISIDKIYQPGGSYF